MMHSLKSERDFFKNKYLEEVRRADAAEYQFKMCAFLYKKGCE